VTDVGERPVVKPEADPAVERGRRRWVQRRHLGLLIAGAAILLLNLGNDFDGRSAGAAVDELGYLGNARSLTDGEPVLSWGRSPYRVAYSLLISPITAVTDDPVRVFQRVVDLNSVLVVVLFGLLYLLVARLLPERPSWLHIGIAGVAACYPPVMLYANTAFSEVLLMVTFAAWVLLVFRVRDHPSSPVGWLVFGSCSYFAYFAHGRFVGLLPVSLVVVGWFAMRERERRSLWAVAGLVAAHVFLRLPQVENSSRSLGSEADRTLGNALSHPRAFVSTVWAQSWLSVVASAVLPVIAVAVILTSRAARRWMADRWIGWSALIVGCLAVLGVSSLFMVGGVLERDEFTFLIYERYVAAILPTVVCLSLVLILRGRWEAVAFDRVVITGASIMGVVVVFLSVERGSYFDRYPFMLNVPSMGVFDTHRVRGLWAMSMAALLVGLLLVAVLWWRPAVGLVAAAVLAVSVAYDTGDKVIGPYYAERARQRHVSEVLDGLGPSFDGRVVYDSRLGPSFYLYMYSWLEPELEFTPLDPLAADLAGRPLISSLDLVGGDADLRLVMLENIAPGYGHEGLGLWVPPGDLADSLDDRSWLAPAGFGGAVDADYLRLVDAELSLVAGRSATAGPGEHVMVEVAVANVGAAALFNSRELTTDSGAFRIGARVLGSEGEVLYEGRGVLDQGLLPGETSIVTAMIESPGQLGDYRVVIAPLIEGHRRLDDRALELQLVVSE
jgi:hypothetical protein